MSRKGIEVNQIVAIDENGGIGIDGDIPWKLSKDWEHFLRLTTKPKVKSDCSLDDNTFYLLTVILYLLAFSISFWSFDRLTSSLSCAGYLEDYLLRNMLNLMHCLTLWRRNAGLQSYAL